MARADVQVSIVNQFNSAEYVPDTWVPLRAIIGNDGAEPIDGVITSTLPVADGAGRMTVEAKVLVPARSRVRATLFAPLGAGDPQPVSRDKNKPDATRKPIAIVYLNQGVTKRAQSDVMLLPAGSTTGDATVRKSAFVEVLTDESSEADSNDSTPLRKLMAESIGAPVVLWVTSPAEAPSHPIAYDSVRVVSLGAARPDLMKVAQRDALLSYVRTGGTLLVSAPGDASIRSSWLAPYLPVHPLGTRVAGKLPTGPGGVEVPLREPVTICEATATPEAVVMVGDAQYVHAAYRKVGLGRVAFTSFPLNAPTFTPDIARDLWAPLLGLNAPDVTLASTRFTAARRGEVLGEMIGTPAPARSVAVALAVGFASVVLVSQLLFRGPRRPLAFATASVIAVLMAGVLAGSRWFTGANEPLTTGRVSVVRLDGSGGFVQETCAYAGDYAKPGDLALSLDDPAAVLRPAMFDGTDAPTLCVSPFGVADAQAESGVINRVWQADAPVARGASASAVGRFDESGLRLTVKNDLGGPIDAPVLLAGTNVYRLPALAGGEATVAVAPDTRNPAPVPSSESNDVADQEANVRARAARFLNTGAIVSEVDNLRASVMSAVFTPATGGPVGTTGDSMTANLTAPAMNDAEFEGADDEKKPASNVPATTASPVRAHAMPARLSVAGWLTTPAAAPAIIRPSVTPAVDHSLVLVTFPVTIEPSRPGSNVKFDIGFNTLVSGPVPLPVYDGATGTWLSSSQPGSWQIGFRPPVDSGEKIVPTKVTIQGNVQLPVQKMTLRRGQVRDGRLAQPNLAGETVVEWQNVFTAQAPVTFDATPADFDSNGTVWFLVDVENTTAPGNVVPLWSVTELGATIEARVEDTEDRR